MIRRARMVERLRDDRGAGYIAAFIVLFGMLTFGAVGLLVDSARILSAERHASAAAYEAARAGAQAVDPSSARAGAAAVDAGPAVAEARSAAGSLIAGSGAQLSGVRVEGDRVVVTITRHVDPWFPGLSARTISETGTARLAVGVTEEGT